MIGDRLGLYPRARHRRPAHLRGARRAHRTAERYVREWLNAQAASGYVTYHPESGRYSLTPEQAMAFADEDGPAFIVGAFQTAVAAGRIVDKLTEAFRTGEGVGWHEHDHGALPRRRAVLPLVVSRQPGAGVDPGARRRGGEAAGRRARRRHRLRPRRLDDHHGAGLPGVAVRRLRLAPGLDRRRQRRARKAGVADRCRFEVAGAKDFPGMDYDLVTVFDALHDMGDPAGAARHVRRRSRPTAAG